MALSVVSHAKGQLTGTVDQLYVRAHDNLHYVTLNADSERTGSPQCATNGYFMIMDENSAAGKSQYSLLLAAKMANKRIKIVGNGTCNRWGDGEDISYILFLD